MSLLLLFNQAGVVAPQIIKVAFSDKQSNIDFASRQTEVAFTDKKTSLTFTKVDC